MWRGADVYLPIVFERGRVVEGVRGVHLLGRLKPGVTQAQAEAHLRPIIEEIGDKKPKIVSTGGLATLIASGSRYIGIVDEMLTLDGMRIIYERNTGARQAKKAQSAGEKRAM